MLNRFPGFAAAVLWALLCAAARAEVVWIEAEAPAASTFPARNPFAPVTPAEQQVLSGGAWIGVDGPRGADAFAEYRFSFEKAGSFDVYARKFWQHGPFRWRVNDGPWRDAGRGLALIDRAELRKHVEASWVSLGRIDLPAGAHKLRVELAERTGPAAFDCFVFASSPFTPRGALKPGQKLASAPPGFFAFEPDDDPFHDGSPIDLRALNEPLAGAGGRLAARDGKIVRAATGEPVPLWGVNVRPDLVGAEPAAIDRLGRHLAKFGVNLVRVHMPAGDQRGPDPAAIERVQRFSSAMKQHGIYTALSIYFPLWLKLNPSDGFGDYRDQNPFGLIFIDEKFQALHRRWFEALLVPPNPHDPAGLPLGKDPAVALVELVNEDSLFFWTFKPYETVPPEPMAALERRFGRWLGDRHGSIDAATKRWDGARVRGDDFAGGRVGFLGLWDIANRRGPRAADTAAFLAEVQAEFFTGARAFLRERCGYDGLVIASNWVTADGRVLGPLDKLSNARASDVMDRHGYFSGKHEGPRAAWAIDPGDTFVDRAGVRFDDESGDRSKRAWWLPAWDPQYDGMPSVISELNWTPPNRFRAEMPLLCAAYGALQGTDGFAFFALEGIGAWDSRLDKFSLQSPVGIGQFPAAALAFRRGMIRESEAPAVQAWLDPERLRALSGGPAWRTGDLDNLRARDIPPDAADSADGSSPFAFDPLAFAVGRVELRFARGEVALRTADLSKHIDRRAGVVRSLTGELSWDYGRGVVTLHAPQVRAAGGFLGSAGAIDLGGVQFELKNEYAVAWVLSLDGQPVESSKRLLVQVVTEEQNNGFATNDGPAGRRTIASPGGAPVSVKKIEGSVAFSGESAIRVTPLDFNGYPEPASLPAPGGRFTLRPDRLWYLVER